MLCFWHLTVWRVSGTEKCCCHLHYYCCSLLLHAVFSKISFLIQLVSFGNRKLGTKPTDNTVETTICTKLLAYVNSQEFAIAGMARNRINDVYHWLTPGKDQERNLFSATLHMMTVSMISMSLAGLKWFTISGGVCTPYLTLSDFFWFGYIQTDTELPGLNKNLLAWLCCYWVSLQERNVSLPAWWIWWGL